MSYHRRGMVGTTEFFRAANLVWATDELLPKVAHQLGRQLRIAEVGCSTGEETWSMAAQLAFRGVDFHITAIDRSDETFQEAHTARYPYKYRELMENARDNKVPDGCLDYFVDIRTNTWRDPVVVDNSLKEHVTFMEHDVLSSPLPSGEYDVVTAFNFLYYFTPEGQRLALDNMFAGLSPGGYFIRDHGQRNDPEWATITQDYPLVPSGGEHSWPSSIFRK